LLFFFAPIIACKVTSSFITFPANISL